MSDPNRKAEKAARVAAERAKYEEQIRGIQFHEWPKISRLNRDIIITEKIDGTNAAIGIIETVGTTGGGPDYEVLSRHYHVYAQSRSRIITPASDNMGFARWVEQHSQTLIETLGPGLHFGEWWGVGIQRGYDLSERRFSLFNTEKWEDNEDGKLALSRARTMGCAIYAVPVLYKGPWTGVLGYIDGPMTEVASAVGEGPVWLDPETQTDWSEIKGQPNPRPRYAPNFILEFLKRVGSQASAGYMNPEGICVFHRASGTILKATIENDEKHKFEA